MANHSVPVKQLILVPALISLGVTLLRLLGELQGWSPLLFNGAAGGGAALVGIVWLVPIFGIYFTLKLAGSGHLAPGSGRIIGFSLLAAALFFAVGSLPWLIGISFPGDFLFLALASMAAIALCFRGSPALNKTLFAYGLSARIPVMVVMLFAILGNWGTHYDRPPPGFPPEAGPLAKFFWIGLLPQLTLWIAFTTIVGSLFGGIALAISGRKKA